MDRFLHISLHLAEDGESKHMDKIQEIKHDIKKTWKNIKQDSFLL